MELHRNEGAGEMGDPRGNPQTSGIVWHVSRLDKSGEQPCPQSHWCAGKQHCQSPVTRCPAKEGSVSQDGSNYSLKGLPGQAILRNEHIIRWLLRCSILYWCSKIEGIASVRGGVAIGAKQRKSDRNGLRVSALYPVERLDCSPPTKMNRVQSLATSVLDFHKWESCWMMTLVGRLSRGSPVSPAFAFLRCSISASISSHLFFGLAGSDRRTVTTINATSIIKRQNHLEWCTTQPLTSMFVVRLIWPLPAEAVAATQLFQMATLPLLSCEWVV
ncbi:hypothetical protein PR048_031144 [Dryococelus australis]|uniref:Uncharacterized protein n=1 Tax=Dryococelus australis TaxID=614101 RepID=A0ABQ9G7K0_9NEOP|nr:hypothetical protein PR048_031144 [Dryococelus australis]